LSLFSEFYSESNKGGPLGPPLFISVVVRLLQAVPVQV